MTAFEINDYSKIDREYKDTVVDDMLKRRQYPLWLLNPYLLELMDMRLSDNVSFSQIVELSRVCDIKLALKAYKQRDADELDQRIKTGIEQCYGK